MEKVALFLAGTGVTILYTQLPNPDSKPLITASSTLVVTGCGLLSTLILLDLIGINSLSF